MKLKIEIKTGSIPGPAPILEAADILRSLADDMEEGRELSDAGDHCTLTDTMGNKVGKAMLAK